MASYTYEEVSPHPDRPDRIPCKCCRLDNGLDLPVPQDLSLKEIRALATSFSHSIFSDWTQLNAILKRFETSIRRRWLKKTAKQRRKILLTVRPNIPHVHRPDFEGFRNAGNSRISREITCRAGVHLTPYINLQDLQRGHNLLLFIHSRGRNMPMEFASTDGGKAHLGHGWYTEPVADGIAMLLSIGVASLTPRQYGMLSPVSKLPPRVGITHSFDPMWGLLTLEIQQSIYSFLLQTVQQIIHDVPPADWRLAPHEPTPAPLSNPTDVRETWSAHMLEADYCKLREISLSQMAFLIDGRRLAAEDHICSLREDPGYFLEHLKEWREHHFINGDNTARNWRVIAGQVFSNALNALHWWSMISKLLASMRPIHEQVGAAVAGGTRLKKEDEMLWATFSECLHHMIKKPMQNIEIMFPTSSGLRNVMKRPHRFRSCLDIDRCIRGAEHGWHMKPAASHAQRRACRVFYILSGLDMDQLNLHGLRAMIQEAQYMLEHDAEVSQLIEDWLLTDFLDLAVLADLQDCVSRFHPYSKSWNAADVAKGEVVATCMNPIHAKSRHHVQAIIYSSFQVKSLGIPTDGRFHYPSGKRLTAAVVQDLQTAEAALKSYWAEVEFHMERYGFKLDGLLKHHLGRDPSGVHSTKNWEEQKVVLLEPSDAHCGSTNHDKLPTTPPKSKENRKTEIVSDERIKRKTHGAAQEGPEAVLLTPPPTPANDLAVRPRKPTSIPRRSFKVMSALLPSSSTISQAPREVSWDDFIYALNSIGLVPEKLYGSVWIFKPLSEGEGLVNVDRSIQFHEPKNVRRGNKIDLTQVRRFGDRLKRAFGWDGETFSCA